MNTINEKSTENSNENSNEKSSGTSSNEKWQYDNIEDVDLENIREIEDRWKKYEFTDGFCIECMNDAIRHYDRNMTPSCADSSYDFIKGRYDSGQYDMLYGLNDHPGRYEGEMLAYSAKDVWTLINVIRDLTNK